MQSLTIPTARVFKPLLAPSRYKGAWGGRGSGKSHFYADNLVDRHLERGRRSVCIREVQKSLKDSAKRLIEDKLLEHRLGERHGFRVLNDAIKTPGDGVILFQGMQDHTAESIKSLEGFDTAWVEEAQTLSHKSLQLLRPTIRGNESELWFSWNPRRKLDPVDAMLRGPSPPTGSVVVKANWIDNPWFPSVLEQERLDCLKNNPEQYDHVWEGGYITVADGAYYAQQIATARLEHRIGHVPADGNLPYKAFCDIGGTGARSDAFAIWIAQWVGLEIRMLDYYEAVGQPVGTHLAWLRERGYRPSDCMIYLPHDGSTSDRVYDVSYETAFKGAGYTVEVIKNQGRGAASMRIEALRKLFPQIRFNEATTQGGIDALGWYHEKRDDVRGIGLGPEHDWASHCADAAGLMAVAYKPPSVSAPVKLNFKGWA